MGVALIGAMGQVLLQLKSSPEIRILIIRIFASRIEQRSCKWCDSNWRLWLCGLSALTRQSKGEHKSQGQCRKRNLLWRTIKTSTGDSTVEAQCACDPQKSLQPFLKLKKPSLEISTEPVPFETVKQADLTLQGQTKVLTSGQNESGPYWQRWVVDGQEVHSRWKQGY